MAYFNQFVIGAARLRAMSAIQIVAANLFAVTKQYVEFG
jgi:hypothetical protein